MYGWLPPGGRTPAQTGERTKPAMEGIMSVAQQAFILTGELFVLSFAAIFVFWFADRVRSNFFGTRELQVSWPGRSHRVARMRARRRAQWRSRSDDRTHLVT